LWLQIRGTAVKVTRFQDAVRKRRKKRGHLTIRERDREREGGGSERERVPQCFLGRRVWLLQRRHRPAYVPDCLVQVGKVMPLITDSLY